MKDFFPLLVILFVLVGLMILVIISANVMDIKNANHQQEMLQICLEHGYSTYHDGSCFSNSVPISR